MLPKKLEFKDTRQKICVPLAMSTIFRKKSFKLKRYSSCRYNERQLIDVTVVRHNVRTYRFLPADTRYVGIWNITSLVYCIYGMASYSSTAVPCTDCWVLLLLLRVRSTATAGGQV